MDNRTYYYARVSSKEQNLARQIEAFKKLGAEDRDIITDKASGKDMSRAGYQALKTTMLRSGDTLVIKSLDRLSRNMDNTRKELQWFRDNGITVRIIDLPQTMDSSLDGNSLIGKMVLNILIEVLGTFAEQERQNIKSRQAEGVKAMPVNEKGKKVSTRTGNEIGRPEQIKPANWEEVMQEWRSGRITAKEAMELTGLKRTSFYKLAKEEHQ